MPGLGQKFKVVFIFPQNIPRFAAPLCAVQKKNFPFRFFVILPSYFFLLFAFVWKKFAILVLSVLLSKPSATIMLLTLGSLKFTARQLEVINTIHGIW